MWNPEAMRWALIAQNEKLPPARRMQAMAILGMMADAGRLVIDTPTTAKILPFEKPKTIWHNGARVRTR